MDNNNDYIFHIRWDDVDNIRYHVGFLAKIDDNYYLIMSDKKRLKDACKNGYIGLPGFKDGHVYRSPELFDFFKRRIINKGYENPCEELKENNGVSMVDSYTVREVSDKNHLKYKKAILAAYKLQIKKEWRKSRRKNREIGVRT